MGVDMAIVGGGPSGLATALFAAREGLSVVLVERRNPPLDKACGEGIMPPGVALLGDMGVDTKTIEHRPFLGIRYIDGAMAAEARFASEPGRGIRRTRLVGAMVDRAQKLGVDLRYGCRAWEWSFGPKGRVRLDTDHGPVDSRILVGADGLHSRLRRGIGVEAPARGPRRYGVRRHFELAPWSDFVEVFWADGGEAYVTPVGEKQVGVAVLWSGKAARFEELLQRFPDLVARLADAPFSTEARGAGPFRQRVRRRYQGPVALVGDAAGYVDALTGEGLSLAFRSAKALVETVVRDRGFASYERAYRRLSRRYYLMTGLLLGMAVRPRLRRRVVALLARHPGLFDRLLAFAAQ